MEKREIQPQSSGWTEPTCLQKSEALLTEQFQLPDFAPDRMGTQIGSEPSNASESGVRQRDHHRDVAQRALAIRRLQFPNARARLGLGSAAKKRKHKPQAKTERPLRMLNGDYEKKLTSFLVDGI